MERLIKNKKTYYLVYLLMLAQNILFIINSYLTINMTQSAIKMNLNEFIYYLGIDLVLLITISVMNYYTLKSQALVSRNLALNLKNSFINNTINNYVEAEVDENKIISNLTNDVDFVINNSLQAKFNVCNAIFGTVIPLIGAALIHWSFLIVFPLSALVSMFVSKKLSPALQDLSCKRSNSNGEYIKVLNNTLKGFNVLRNFDGFAYFENKLKESNNELEDKKFEFSKKQGFLQSVIMISIIVSQLAYIIVSGVLLIMGAISVASIVGLMNIAQMFFNNAQNAVFSYMRLVGNKPILEKIINLEEIAMKNNADIILREKIVVKNLSYTYDDRQIKYPDMEFILGEKYILKGKSGCGKSTLLKIMTKQLSGYSGDVFFDNQSISDINPKHIVSFMAYIEQTPYIFNDTIENNILLGKNMDKDRFDKIINQSGLTELVSQRTKDYLINKDVSNISGGEIKRLAIARALASEKKIIILDEGLSNLDKETANTIEQTLLKIEGITLIFVSHDESIDLNNYTRVITLE